MAKALDLSRMAVNRIWRAFGLQPHRSETFKLPTDPLLVEKVRDIVGLYLHPPAHAAVFCVDEKTAIQALDRRDPVLPMSPGRSTRMPTQPMDSATLARFTSVNCQSSSELPDTPA